MTRPRLPTGEVTFLFTDIEGSTRLLQTLGDDYGPIQDDHGRLVRAAITRGRGVEVRSEGDAFFAVFPSAPQAVRAAVEAQRALASHPWSHGKPLRVRMGLHTGSARLGGDDYIGIDVNRAARIAAAGHGGQVLLSGPTRALIDRALPQGVALRDLGKHRLRDLAGPTHLYDLVIDGLPSDFPPLRSLQVPTNLPAELTSFVGREREQRELEGLLEVSRLVTLTGPGGSGKTRLALRVAARLLDRFPDGAFFVELASIREADLVPGVVASVVGAGELGPLPVSEVLQRELRERTALLVLDNFEQVIEAAPSVGNLLAAAPNVRVLVTSRAPLRIPGEQEFPLGPLALPDGVPPPEEFLEFEALALFVQRARAIDPAFTVDEGNAGAVVEICRRLDGLPLALELAASRTRLLSPEGILERLDDALSLLAEGGRGLPSRQRTLRGAIGWSYDLLSPEAAHLFRRASVFAGGFDLEAATRVCGSPEPETIEGITSLIESGLLHRVPSAVPPRYEMLQTIREYGLERLDASGEGPEVRRRHGSHFLDLVEAPGGIRGPNLQHQLELFDLEHDNLRAALDWALAADEGEIGLRLVHGLWRFWHFHGHLSAGRRWAERVLTLGSAAARTPARARALFAEGGLAYWQLDVAATARAYDEALSIFREVGDRAGIAKAIYNGAYIPLLNGELETSERRFREALAIFEDLGDRHGVADALFGISVTTRLRGDYESSRAAADRSLELHADWGDLFGITAGQFALGRAAAEMGELATARRLFLQTLETGELVRDWTGVAMSLDNLAADEWARGDRLRAVRIAGAADALKEEMGGEAPPELLDLPDLRIEAARLLSPGELEAAWQEGRSMSREEAIALARESAVNV